MLDNIKYLVCFKSVSKDIADKNYDEALEKLNYLINEEFRLSETFLERGRLCHKLLMLEEAYSDFTYIITHCVKKDNAYRERMFLNFEMGLFGEAIYDASKIIDVFKDDFEIKRIIFLSLVFAGKQKEARDYIMNYFDMNKYIVLNFLFQQAAILLSDDELAKCLKLLEIIELIDPNNPLKLLKEANIYELAGDDCKKEELLKQIESVFPKYFISHFRFSDMYQDKNLLEISFLLELKIFDTQGLFTYPMKILEGYKNYSEGRIIDTKECFEAAIAINSNKPEAYVLLAQTLQLISGYDNKDCLRDAELNYRKAMDIYRNESLSDKVEEMKRQIKHISSGANIFNSFT